MKNYKVAIVGGGPGGMMAGIAAGKYSNKKTKIVLIEKTDSLGKKLLLTGGGRCNIANASPIKTQLDKFKDKNFLKHSFYTLNNEQLLAIFKEKGLEFKEENGRYFPITDDSKSVLNILRDYLKELKIDILLNNPVKSIAKSKKDLSFSEESIAKNKKDLFEIKTKKSTIFSEKVILATGGISYPQTGSSGDGYKIATAFSHSIATLKPGLTPLKVKNENLKKLSGITLEDVEVSYKQKNNSKNTHVKIRGNVLITHFGFSGPGILDLSNFIVKDNIQANIDFNLNNYENNKNKHFNKDKNNFNLNNYENNKNKHFNKDKNNFNDVVIFIDLIPNISHEELGKKIAKDLPKYGKNKIKNYMKFYLKNRFIDFFLSLANVEGDKTLSNMTKEDKNKIIANLKHLKVEIASLMPAKVAMITCGGVNIDEINPKTMESKLANGLYFAGELLEPFGPTGGYNLQIAFSTGYLAGKSCTETIKLN
ncbi:MAG: aminoacetone oxidase family FAD-binding enzyme [Methanobrevibacter sp.]|nr:aminoacetone oxidase family FAD-binding enzyme [Methanobrevibacter sp.]